MVVATQDVPARTVIAPEMVTVVKTSPEAVTTGAAADPAQVVGRATLYPLRKGEQVLPERLAGAGTLALSDLTPRGLVAAAVKVAAETAAGGLVLPGDHVDVLAACDLEGGGGRTTVALSVVRDVTLLAVGNRLAQPAAQGEVTRAAEGEKDAQVAVLALTERQAAAVAAAAKRCTLSLALRPYGGGEPEAAAPVLPGPGTLPPDLAALVDVH